MAGLPWFALWSDFPDHPKTIQLCAKLRDPNGGMYVVRLLSYCARLAHDGLVPADVLEHAAAWRGKPNALLDALAQVGFVEAGPTGTYKVHGWEERNGAHVRKRERDAKKPRGNRAGPASVPRGTTEGPTRVERERETIVSEGDRFREERDSARAERDASPPLDDEQAAKAVLELARREYATLVRRPYEHASRKAALADERAATELYRVAAGDLEEIAIRWRTGLQNDSARGEWPEIRTLAALQRHWAEFGHTPAEVKAGLRRLGSGVIP